MCSLYFLPFQDAAAAAGAQSVGSDGFQPKQAWVFDGSANAAATYQVALGQAGFLAEVSAPPCTTDRQLGMILSLFGRGVSQPSSLTFSFDAHVFPRPPDASSSPFDPGTIQTDCDVLAMFADVQAYLAKTQLQALQVQAAVGDCLSSVKELGRQLHDAVEHAQFNEVPHFGAFCALGGIAPDPNSTELQSFGRCGACALALVSVPQMIDSLQLELSSCTAAKNQLEADLLTVQQLVSSQAEVCTGTKAAIEADGLELQGRAEGSYAIASGVVTALNGVAAECTLDKVQASCAKCNPGSPRPGPPGVGHTVASGLSLDRLAQAFRRAAARASDPVPQAHLWDVAMRLERVPEYRVQRATFKTASSISQELVALAPPDLPDDGRSPLAIVLTELDRDAPRPTLTPSGQRRVFDVMRAFYDLVTPLR